MTFLSMQVRSDAPSVDQLYVRRKEVDYTREGLLNTTRGICSCGWASPLYDVACGSNRVLDPVDRDLHAHIVAMREAAK